jgi:hypothetical protein
MDQNQQTSQPSDELVRAVALGIFKAQQAFEADQGQDLPDRHFKVAIVLYLAMAQGALAAIAAHSADEFDTP